MPLGRSNGRALGFLRLVLCGIGASAASGCASLPIDRATVFHEETAYSTAHPYYLEFCAVSEINKKPGYGADIRGGIGGHSTLYLNGVCRMGEGYPEIRLCPDDSASQGVGLSVNAHFANANWVAVPGRDFFYHGDLEPGRRLTPAVYDATKFHAKRLGLYDAIRFHERAFGDMPKGYARDAYKYEVSIGTDFAIGYGRDRYCARVPLSAARMTRVVGYLNALNRPYRDGAAEYEWNVLTDNCIHVAHNALSAAGFWPEWPTHRPVLVSAFDFPVPKNEFVNIVRRANDLPIENPLAVWRDESARRALLAGDGLPTREGALATFEPMTRDNALYDTDVRLIFYDEPVFGPYERWYRRIVAQKRYTDPRANLRYFADLYARSETTLQPLAWWRDAHPGLASERDFVAFLARYRDEIARRSASVAREMANAFAFSAPPSRSIETR